MTYGDAIFARYWAEHSLPAGYRRVEYLESTGAQWIDTGVVPVQSTRIEFQFSLSAIPQDTFAVAFGALEYYNNYGYALFLNNTVPVQARTGYSSNPNIISNLSVMTNVWYEGMLEFNHLGLNGIDYYPSMNNTWYALSRSVYIFSCNAYSVPERRHCKARYRYFHVMDDSAPVRSFIPCVRVADNKPGLYDLCGSICPLTGTPFYVNAGTGADFTWGEL